MQVIHHPRVAWDAARVLVAAAPDDALSAWLGGELGRLFGPACQQALRETRDRLRWTGDERTPVEAGRWRVRLEDALRDDPKAAGALRALADTAARRLRARQAA